MNTNAYNKSASRQGSFVHEQVIAPARGAACNDMEKWKAVIGYEGAYEVSDTGRVRSLRRLVNSNRNGLRTCKNRILKLGPDSNGYLRVNLSVGANRKIHLVHRIVARAFIGPRPSGFVCCHRDGDKINNAASNLRYDSYSGNERDKLAHGTHNRGERHPMVKLTEEQVIAIRRDNRTHYSIANDYGVARVTISRIQSLKSWSWL